MKFLKILLISILVLIVAATVGLFIFVRTFDVNKFAPQITKEISRVLGRQAGIGRVGLNISWGKGVALSINNLTVSDDPQFSKEDFLSIKDIILGVDIQALFSKRQLRVSDVQINAPRILLIRDKQGQINTQSLAAAQRNLDSGAENTKVESPSETQSQAPSNTSTNSLPLALLIQSIQIKNATLTFIDKTFDPAINIETSGIILNINNFSLAEPCDFVLEASIFSSRKNVKAKGVLNVDVSKNTVQLKDMLITSDLSDVSLAKLEQSLPMVKGVLKEGFAGDIDLSLDEMTINNQGLADLSMKGSLKRGKLALKGVAPPLNNITVSFQADENNIKIKDSSLEFASGKIKAQGVINDYPKSQAFQFATTLEGVDLGKLIPKESSSVEFQGKAYGQIDLNGKGFNPDSILSSLAGSNNFDIKEGKLVDINILKLVLSKISMIPGLVDDLEANLSDKYKEKLSEKDTSFKNIALKTSLQKKNILLENAEAEGDGFRLTGQGEMSFNQDISLSAVLHVVPELTKSMVKANKNLEYLVDEAGEIFIPITVSGKVAALAVAPDLEYLGKKIYQNKGREELDKVLDKVFGKDEETPQAPSQPTDGSPSQPSPSQEPAQGEKSIEKELIKGVLDQIFGNDK